jgi:hypothetical protein
MIAEAEIPAPVPSSPRLSPADIPEVTVMVAFDPDPSTGPQFTFTTPSGVGRHLVVTERTTLTFTLTGETGATWADPPATIVSAPKDYPPPPSSGNSVSFTIDPPGHYFVPWIFNFNIDWEDGSTDIKGIMSPSFFLINVDVNAIQDGILKLGVEVDYVADTGEFRLTPVASDSSVGITLASQLILVNTFRSAITFNLETTTTTSSTPPEPATLPTSSAIVWGAGTAPSWASAPPPADNTTQQLQITQGSGDTIAQLAGFQFAINYEGVTILSPDPILINATIGDGST